jgi:hypothetical protein
VGESSRSARSRQRQRPGRSARTCADSARAFHFSSRAADSLVRRRCVSRYLELADQIPLRHPALLTGQSPPDKPEAESDRLLRHTCWSPASSRARTTMPIVWPTDRLSKGRHGLILEPRHRRNVPGSEVIVQPSGDTVCLTTQKPNPSIRDASSWRLAAIGRSGVHFLRPRHPEAWRLAEDGVGR